VVIVWSLCIHFSNSVEDPTTDASLKSTFIGFRKRLGSAEYMLDIGLMYDSSFLCYPVKFRSYDNAVKSRTPYQKHNTGEVIEGFRDEPGEKESVGLGS
jgi:hypothetical protein